MTGYNSKVRISVVIITKNEEANIADCLKSVFGWVDEIILVDDQSTDMTKQIAEKFTDKIFVRKMDNEGAHRNWAYAQASNLWVFSLDADERVTPELRDAIINLFKSEPEFQAYTVRRRNYLGDYWLRYGGEYPAAQLRLFRKDKFKYEEAEVHPRVFLEGGCGHLKADLIHYSWKDFGDFLAKLNRQTTLEAQKWYSTKRKMPLGKALWRVQDRFFRRYLHKKGYKDGFMGFMIACFDSVYQLMSYAKYWEMKKYAKN
jgi:glycosyltransferase involved in cell wall biosynthesis